MISYKIYKIFQYLDNFESLKFRPVENCYYNPVTNLFIKSGKDGFWFGDQRIILTKEDSNILAEIPALDVHTFGKTHSQALIRCVKHAATYYDDLVEDGVYSENDEKRKSLLESCFDKMYNQFIGNQVFTTFVSSTFLTTSA